MYPNANIDTDMASCWQNDRQWARSETKITSTWRHLHFNGILLSICNIASALTQSKHLDFTDCEVFWMWQIYEKVLSNGSVLALDLIRHGWDGVPLPLATVTVAQMIQVVPGWDRRLDVTHNHTEVLQTGRWGKIKMNVMSNRWYYWNVMSMG